MMRLPVISALALSALTAGAVCAAPKAPARQAAAASPAALLVQKLLDARAAGDAARMRALYLTEQQKMFGPPSEMSKAVRDLTAQPHSDKDMPPGMLALIALVYDVQNTLHFKYRVLGTAPNDPKTVQVRAYQVGQPESSIQVIPIVLSPDPQAGGALRINLEQSADRISPVPRAAAQRTSSESNLKQIALCIFQYMQDNDNRLPDADRWVDEIMPYIKSNEVFRDPAAPAGEKWSYAFNDAYSGKHLSELKDPAGEILVFESTLGVKNAHDDGASIPNPGRHQGGTDYAFADGHVKWLRDDQRPSLTPAP